MDRSSRISFMSVECNPGDSMSLKCRRCCCFCQHAVDNPKAKASQASSTSVINLVRANSNLLSHAAESSRICWVGHNGDDDDDGGGQYEAGVWGQAEEKHICRVEAGRRDVGDEWLVWVLPLYESFSGLPVHFDTGSSLPRAWTVREAATAEGVREQDLSQGQGVRYMS